MSKKRPPLTLVAGVDFGETSGSVLLHAIELASEVDGAQLYFMHVSKDTDSARRAAEAEKLRSMVVDVLTKTPRRSRFRVAVHVVYGSPARELVAFAAHVDADYVVVGMPGRRPMRQLILGSVAEHVLRAAGCPVVVARPRNHDLSAEAPEVEPPCPDCVRTRAESGGAKIWCARHSEHHPRAHYMTYDTEPSEAPMRPWGFEHD